MKFDLNKMRNARSDEIEAARTLIASEISELDTAEARQAVSYLVAHDHWPNYEKPQWFLKAKDLVERSNDDYGVEMSGLLTLKAVFSHMITEPVRG